MIVPMPSRASGMGIRILRGYVVGIEDQKIYAIKER